MPGAPRILGSPEEVWELELTRRDVWSDDEGMKPSIFSSRKRNIVGAVNIDAGDPSRPEAIFSRRVHNVRGVLRILGRHSSVVRKHIVEVGSA